MIKRIKILIYLLIIALLLSCPLDENTKDEQKPIKFNITPAWTLEVPSGSYYKYDIRENITFRDDPLDDGLLAFNLDTGEKKWEITGAGNYHNTIIVDDYLCMLASTPAILLINPEDGNIEKEIKLLLNGEEEFGSNIFSNSGFNIYSSGSRLFWGTQRNKYNEKPLGLVSIDIIKDVSLNNNNEYVGNIKILYENDLSYDEWCKDQIYIEDDIIYFLSNSKKYSDFWKPKIRAYNFKTETLLWETEPENLFAGGYYVFHNRGENLFLSDGRGYGLINKSTGNLIYEETPGSGSDADGYIVDNLFYSTNPSSDLLNLANGNVHCVNMDTGKTVWTYLHEFSLGARPVVYKGYLFVPAPDALYIHNAEDGTLLGSSESVYGDFSQGNYNFIYKDKYMILDGGNKIFSLDLDKVIEKIE